MTCALRVATGVLLLGAWLGAANAAIQPFGNFPGDPQPYSTLREGADGALHAVATTGKTPDFGQVMRLGLDGSIQSLVTFGPAMGSVNGLGNDLIVGRDGNFYGTTRGGTALNPDGLVFRLTPDGTFKVLHRFNYDVDQLQAPLPGMAEGPDGTLYGFATRQGAWCVWALAPDRSLRTVKAFDHPFVPLPTPPLVVSGSYLYWADSCCVERMTRDGTIKAIHAFSTLEGGYNAFGGLVAGSDGNLYGTTVHGGDHGYGTIFRVTPQGDYTTLHAFESNDGIPRNPLVFGADGLLYGNTSDDGQTGAGTLFRIDADGTFRHIQDYPGFGGARGDGPLVATTNGDLYGISHPSTVETDPVRMAYRFRADRPLPFRFLWRHDGAPGEFRTSPAIAITGFSADLPVLLTGHDSARVRINDGPWSRDPGPLRIGDVVQLRLTAGPAETARHARIEVGGVAASWRLTTPIDDVPDPLHFQDIGSAPPRTMTRSPALALSGFSVRLPIQVSGPSSFRYRVNGGAWTSEPGTVVNRDILELRMLSPTPYETREGHVSIGTVSDTWSVTGGPAVP